MPICYVTVQHGFNRMIMAAARNQAMSRNSFAPLKVTDMKPNTILLSAFALSFATALQAQYAPPDPAGLEGVIVEKYYVADANDAADADGGTNLSAGSTTYRVFVDMLDGYKLLAIAGYVDHDLTFNTTTEFFYNEDRGDAFGRLINDIHLDKNTVAIDSWLTMGAASDAHWGVPKGEDTDGTVVGGVNNDGGSNAVVGGLLVNNAPEMGLPLTQSDGLYLDVAAPPTTVNVGEAPTIFNEPGGSSFTTQEWALGVLGGIGSPLPGNKVLIGQFTTDGVFSFCLNFWLKIPQDLICSTIDCHENLEFYGNLLESDTAGTAISGDNKFTHPTLCFNSATSVVDCLGTTGGTALPGTPCDDGNPDTGDDIWTEGCVCSGVTGITTTDALASMVKVHPNPTNDLLWISLSDPAGRNVSIDLTDGLGRSIQRMDLGRPGGPWQGSMDLTDVSSGVYTLIFTVDGHMHTERVIKQ